MDLKNGTSLRPMAPTEVRSTGAFSLVEFMVSMGILGVILLILASVLDSTSKALITGKEKTGQFREARVAFEYVGRSLEQATLNTYWDYVYETTNSNNPSDEVEAPTRYARQSELHFLVGDAGELLGDPQRYRTHGVFFQAPLGDAKEYSDLSNLLNARGYFVEFGDDSAEVPEFLARVTEKRYRFRLKEFRPPSEENLVYREAVEKLASSETRGVQLDQWYRPDSRLYREQLKYEDIVRTVAENVVALIVSPRISEKEAKARNQEPEDFCPNYRFDSHEDFPQGAQKINGRETKHQLPPVIKIVLVTISERSALILQDANGKEPPPELEIAQEWFQQAKNLEKDLAAFEKQMQNGNVDYRVLRTTLGIRASKWSNES